MTHPIRLRLSRARDFDLQAHSLWTTGISAISTARPSRWGNPFTHRDNALAARTYRAWLTGSFRTSDMFGCNCKLSKARLDVLRRDTINGLHALRGHNLACWCPLPKPGEPDHCHAAMLLEVANG